MLTWVSCIVWQQQSHSGNAKLMGEEADWEGCSANFAPLLCQTLIVSHNSQMYGSVITAATDWLRMSAAEACCPGEAKLHSEGVHSVSVTRCREGRGTDDD